MKRLFVVILVITLLSGCVGYSFSHNAVPIQKKVSSEDGFWHFGIDDIASLHAPNNGTQRYDDEVKWCGLTIYAIVPIPLWLPTCRSYKEVTFVDGRPVNRVDQYLESSSVYVCGPLPWMANRFNGSHQFCMDK